MMGDCDYILKYTQIKERLYLLGTSKATAITDIDHLTLRRFGITPILKGENIETERWLNELLEERGFVTEITDGLDVELYKALNKEKIIGTYQISPLKSDFFIRLRSYFAGVNNGESLQKAKMYARDLITLRINKITTLAVTSTEEGKVLSLLTPEEAVIFKQIRIITSSWKKTLLGEP